MLKTVSGKEHSERAVELIKLVVKALHEDREVVFHSTSLSFEDVLAMIRLQDLRCKFNNLEVKSFLPNEFEIHDYIEEANQNKMVIIDETLESAPIMISFKILRMISSLTEFVITREEDSVEKVVSTNYCASK